MNLPFAILKRIESLGGVFMFPGRDEYAIAERLLAGKFCRNCNGAGGWIANLIEPIGRWRDCPTCEGKG